MEKMWNKRLDERGGQEEGGGERDACLLLAIDGSKRK